MLGKELVLYKKALVAWILHLHTGAYPAFRHFLVIPNALSWTMSNDGPSGILGKTNKNKSLKIKIESKT